MSTITLVNVTKKFGKAAAAVENLTVEIKEGDFVSLLGPSGCGKTTILRMIAGLETPTDGDIYFDGMPVFSASKGINVSPSKRNIGFLFQNYALWPHMTVYKNIAFGLENLKWDKEAIERRVSEICKTMHIDEYAGRYPSELSGGQQQRVAIARTLAPNPQVLLMDEPLSNLDAKLRNGMRAELKRLHAATKATFVYVTHDQAEAMTLSSKICLMKNGRLQQYSPPLELYARPSNLFCADFMGNPGMNFIPCTAKRADSALLLEAEPFNAKFIPNEPIDFSLIGENKKYVLGIRPEFITIANSGPVTGTVISSLPSGMETSVELEVNGVNLSAVAFGNCDYPMDSRVSCRFDGSQYVLFDEESTQNLVLGSLKIV